MNIIHNHVFRLKHDASGEYICLHPRVEPIQLGPTGTASLYFSLSSDHIISRNVTLILIYHRH
jgi:hypothetical protein